MKGLIAAAVVGLVVSSIATARSEPSQYLCISDHAAGLHYDARTGTWGTQTFTAGNKYILRRVTAADWSGHLGGSLRAEKPTPTWMFFDFDDPRLPESMCWNDTYGFYCHPMAAEAEFEPHSLRFQITRLGGFTGQGWELSDPSLRESMRISHPNIDGVNHPDDAVFEIGTCSPF